ncbi:MAG: hypothetical protein ACRDVE_21800 [Actinocrinis sp.]
MTTAHEPRREPGVHLSAEDLSALAEGAQPGVAGADGHLADCAACRAEVDAISELFAAFEILDTPPMPTDVAIRIDAALARESADRAKAPASYNGAASPMANATVRRRRWLTSRGLGWALASLVVVAGGTTAIVSALSSGGGTTASSASASAGSAAGPAKAQAQSPGDTSAPMQSYGQSGGGASSSMLSAWVQQTLSAVHPDAGLSSPCFNDPGFTGKPRVTAANGTFNGEPATLVVYANGNNASTVFAVAYATPCAPGSYHVLSEGVFNK